jgi:hypothetical protein
MRVLARQVKHAFDVTIESPHDADARKHGRSVMFCNQQQRVDRELPFFDFRNGYSLGDSNVV